METRWNRWMVALYRLPWVREAWARRYRAVAGGEIPWTRLRRPLGACRLALITTGGVHLRSDPPFDMSNPEGDASFRVIPATVEPAELTITHDYYDHRDADRDINLVLPLVPLRASIGQGMIGEAAPRFFSWMGHMEGAVLRELRERTAPEVAARLRADGVDAALLVPA